MSKKNGEPPDVVLVTQKYLDTLQSGYLTLEELVRRQQDRMRSPRWLRIFSTLLVFGPWSYGVWCLFQDALR